MFSLLSALIGLLGVIFAFGFIVFIHELGHYLAARRADICCPRFAVGFGPKLFGFDYQGTEFSVRLFPIGGYVQMVGEDPQAQDEYGWSYLVQSFLGGISLPATPQEMGDYLEQNRDRTLEEHKSLRVEDWERLREYVRYLRQPSYETLADVEGNFNSRSVPQRLLTLSGGVLMNFASAFVIFVLVAAVWGHGSFVPDSKPRVSSVMENSPAEKVEISAGSVIKKINGNPVISKWELVSQVARLAGDKIEVTVRLGKDSEKKIEVVPDLALGPVVLYQDAPGVVKTRYPVKQATPELPAGTQIKEFEGVVVQEISELRDHFFQHPTEKAKKLTLKGEEGSSWVIELPSEIALEPGGRMGIVLGGLVSSVRLEPETTLEILSVEQGSLAQEMGIRAKDQILEVQGVSIGGGTELAKIWSQVASRPTFDGKIHLGILGERGGELKYEEYAFPKALAWDQLGFQLQPVSFGAEVKNSVSLIGRIVAMPFLIVVKWFANEVPTEMIVKSSQGPLGIMQNLYALTDSGLGQFLYFLAILNAAVGGFNIIPFPALDGARMMVLLWVAIRGKNVDPESEAKFHFVGIMILLVAMVGFTIFDLQRIFSGVQLIE